MTADFRFGTGKTGAWIDTVAPGPEPIWWSPALRSDSEHLLVGGRTVWVEGSEAPGTLVVAHPNRFGSGEDLVNLAKVAARWRAQAWVVVDPLLAGMVAPGEGLQTLTPGPSREPGWLHRAAERSLQGAEALRRRLVAIPGLQWPVVRPAGRTVTCLAPIGGAEVKEAIAQAGVLVDAPPGWWEGVVTFTVGWWHTRAQLDGVARALAAVLAKGIPEPVADDSLDRIPEDLPRRRLNRIRANLRGD